MKKQNEIKRSSKLTFQDHILVFGAKKKEGKKKKKEEKFERKQKRRRKKYFDKKGIFIKKTKEINGIFGENKIRFLFLRKKISNGKKICKKNVFEKKREMKNIFLFLNVINNIF